MTFLLIKLLYQTYKLNFKYSAILENESCKHLSLCIYILEIMAMEKYSC